MLTTRPATLGDISFSLMPSCSGAMVGTANFCEVEESVTTHERLVSTATALLAHHPILRTHLVHKGGYKYDLADAGLPAADYVERIDVDNEFARVSSREDARATLLRQRSTDIPFRLVLVVCGVARTASLLVYAHHWLADMQSCTTLLKDAIAELDEPNSTKPPSLDADAVVPPSLLDAVPKRYAGLWHAMKTIPKMAGLMTVGKLAAKYDTRFLTAPPTGDLDDCRAGRVEHLIQGEALDALVAAARTHKTTVQGALQAALVYAIVAQRIEQGRMPHPLPRLPLASTGTIDLRRHLPTPLDPRTVSNYSSVSTVRATVDATALTAASPHPPVDAFWTLAAQIVLDLRKSVENGGLIGFIKIMEMVGPKRLTNIFEEFLSNSIQSVANVGRVNLHAQPQHMQLNGGLSIEHSMLASRDGLTVHALTCNRTLTLVANFSMPSMSRETVVRLMDLFLANLDRASK